MYYGNNYSSLLYDIIMRMEVVKCVLVRECRVYLNYLESDKTIAKHLKTDDMLFSGGNGTGLSFYIKYAEESTDDNPVVIAKGIDENGKEFEEKININDIDLRNASYVEMSALEAYYDVDRGNSLSSFPQETGHMGLNERCDLISSFEKVIQDMNKLGKYDLQMFYMRNMNTYLNLERQKKA